MVLVDAHMHLNGTLARRTRQHTTPLLRYLDAISSAAQKNVRISVGHTAMKLFKWKEASAPGSAAL